MLEKIRNRGAWLLLLLPIAVATLFALDALLTAADVDAATRNDHVEPALEASAKPTLEVRDALISEPVQRRSVEGLLPGKPGVDSAPAGEGEPAGPQPTPTLAPTVTGAAPDAGGAPASEIGVPAGNSGPGGDEQSDDWGDDDGDDGDDDEWEDGD